MKSLTRILLTFIGLNSYGQSCSALFTFSSSFEVISFQNQSTLSNAHFFWDFGDGSGSNLMNPTHEYFGNGKFLVTLYATDTISHCSDFYTSWISVSKLSTDPCTPSLEDSFFVANGQHYIKLFDESSGCESYGKNFFSLIGNNGSNVQKLYGPSNFISILFCNNGTLSRPAFKSGALDFDRSKNYTPCSANFEFIAIKEDNSSQNILFKAMNKSASGYHWVFTGFGNPIHRFSDTALIRFPDAPYNSASPSLSNIPWDVFLSIQDQNGCKDSLVQQIIVKPKSTTYVGLNELNPEFGGVAPKVFPNPFHSEITIDLSAMHLNFVEVTVSNSLGQLLFSKSTIKNKEVINSENLSPGIYILQIQTERGINTMKIIKQ